MEMVVAVLAALRAWATRGVNAVIRNWVWIKMPVALLVLLLLAMWLDDQSQMQLDEETGVCAEPNLTEVREGGLKDGRKDAEMEALKAKSVQVVFEQLLLWAFCSLLAWAVNALFLYEAKPSLSADSHWTTVQLLVGFSGIMILLTIVKCRHKWQNPAVVANLLLIASTSYFIARGLDPLTMLRGPNQVDEQVAKVISVALLSTWCFVLPALIHGIVMSALKGGGDNQWLVIMSTLIVTSGVWAAVTLLGKKHLQNGRLNAPGAGQQECDQFAVLQQRLRQQSQDHLTELAGKNNEITNLRRTVQDHETELAGKNDEITKLRRTVQDHETELPGKNNEITKLRRTVQDAEKDAKAKLADNAKLREDISKLRDDMKELRDNMRDAKAELAAKDTDNAKLREDVRKAEQNSAKLRDDMKKAEANETEQKKRADDAVKENQKLAADLKAVNMEQAELMHQYSNSLAETKAKLDEALSKLSTAPQEKAELAELKKMLNDNRQALELEQTKLKQQVVEHGVEILNIQKRDQEALRKLLAELSRMMAENNYVGVRRRLQSEQANF